MGHVSVDGSRLRGKQKPGMGWVDYMGAAVLGRELLQHDVWVKLLVGAAVEGQQQG